MKKSILPQMFGQKMKNALTPRKIILCGTGAVRKTADDEFPVGDDAATAV